MELEFDIRRLMKLVCLAFYEAQAQARGTGCSSSVINVMFFWVVSFFVLQSRFGLLPLFYLLFFFSFFFFRLPPNHKLRFFFSNL
jgi:hypothetical protein